MAETRSKPAVGDIMTWEDANCFASSYNLPSSPDTVCFDNQLIDVHPFIDGLLPDHGIWNFDSDMLIINRLEGPELEQFLDTVPEQDRVSLPSEAIILDDFAIDPSLFETKVNKKRVRVNTDNYETKVAVPKKVKASPKQPRSRLPTSAYRGVSRCTKDGRWQARIRVCKEVVYLGRYQTEEQAAKRYDEAARLHHGKAAMLNFVTSEDILMGRKSVFSEKTAAFEL
jgi:hypothetical protein